MAEIDPQQLNSLFLRLHRSLLQYVGECSPWSDSVSEEGQRSRDVLTEIVATQKKNANSLAQPLEESGWVINYGGYPTIYTDLQFLSLKYLLKQVAISQAEIIKAFDAAAAANPDSPLLKQIADSERGILQAIQGLSAPKLAVTNAG